MRLAPSTVTSILSRMHPPAAAENEPAAPVTLLLENHRAFLRVVLASPGASPGLLDPLPRFAGVMPGEVLRYACRDPFHGRTSWKGTLSAA